MWGSFSNSVVSFGWKKIFVATSRACLDFADDETSSNGNAEDGLECPISWDYFNIVENVMSYNVVTPSAKTVLGINCAALKFSNQQIQIPFFISCPWCHLLTLRLFYKWNLKFPSKNLFLLWKVESLNGDRMKSPLSMSANNQSVWSLRSPSFSQTKLVTTTSEGHYTFIVSTKAMIALMGEAPSHDSQFALQSSHWSFYCCWLFLLLSQKVLQSWSCTC